MKPVSIILLVIFGLLLIGWLGLQIKAKPFNLAGFSQGQVNSIPLPEGLPAPVQRFYNTLYPDGQIPVYESVVITGTGRMRPFGIWLPVRFVMVHNTGTDYRHYFEATWFGLPFLKINEGYVDGKSFFESPMGSYVDDANANQAANLALWAEGGWFPALWVTDARARWQAVDDHTAILFVPFEGGDDSFVVRFDPLTGLVQYTEAMRFRSPGDEHKILWITHEADGKDGEKVYYVTWLDQGKPWAELINQTYYFNRDVSGYIRARGK